jgi:hypothetical protein
VPKLAFARFIDPTMCGTGTWTLSCSGAGRRRAMEAAATPARTPAPPKSSPIQCIRLKSVTRIVRLLRRCLPLFLQILLRSGGGSPRSRTGRRSTSQGLMPNHSGTPGQIETSQKLSLEQITVTSPSTHVTLHLHNRASDLIRFESSQTVWKTLISTNPFCLYKVPSDGG